MTNHSLHFPSTPHWVAVLIAVLVMWWFTSCWELLWWRNELLPPTGLGSLFQLMTVLQKGMNPIAKPSWLHNLLKLGKTSYPSHKYVGNIVQSSKDNALITKSSTTNKLLLSPGTHLQMWLSYQQWLELLKMEMQCFLDCEIVMLRG